MNDSSNNLSGYTPVYLIQDPGVTSANSFVVTHTNQYSKKPTSDNLKCFYENGGNIIDSSFVINNVDTIKPTILKKHDSGIIGNNLKLASFLVPKNDALPINKESLTMGSVILQAPVPVSNGTISLNVNPGSNMKRNIMTAKNSGLQNNNISPKILPKSKPKDILPVPQSSKYELTSVKLLKLGETYHSLSQLNYKQMKIVRHAMKRISKTDNIPQEPTYDPVTNTRIVYKVISPDDLKVVGDNKVIIKEKKKESRKSEHKCIEDVEKDVEIIMPPKEEEILTEPKITRSGRKVKTPNLNMPETSKNKQKRRNGSAISCFQCSNVFSNKFRLLKHYENQPTHLPTNLHSNLFICLLAIVKSCSNEERANVFMQQLEQFIEKIKSLLPCLLKKVDGCEGTSCTINDDIGRIFGMNPGKYNLNMDALTCVKNNEGHCRHNPPKQNSFTADLNKPSKVWLIKHNEEIANNELEVEDCARINSVDSWPLTRKRIWKVKEQKLYTNPKKKRLASETEPPIELGNEDLVALSNTSAINMSQKTDIIYDKDTLSADESIQQITDKSDSILDLIKNQSTKPKGNHAQFYSAHFDIRSSPIKPSSTVFCKFQIDVQKLSNEIQNIRPLMLDKSDNVLQNDIVIPSNSDDTQLDLQGILAEIESPCKNTTDLNHDLNFGTSKHWTIPPVPNDKQSENNFIKTNDMIEPTFISNNTMSFNTPSTVDTISQNEHLNSSDPLNQGQSELNLFDALGNDCLTYPEAEIRHNPADINFDLFSFSNT